MLSDMGYDAKAANGCQEARAVVDEKL